MENRTHKVAVVGASGYTGEELLGLLAAHPGVELVCLTSRQHAGRRLEEVYPRLRPAPGSDRPLLPAFTTPDARSIAATGARFAFLALPHGLAAEYASPLLAAGLRVIDLSADFRLRDAAVYEDYYGHAHPAPELLPDAVYGLPELPGRRPLIASARLVAAPGCYPTSILVPLAPLLARRVDRAGPRLRLQLERSHRRGTQGERRPAFRRGERERQSLRCAAPPPPFGDRAGTLPRIRAAAR